MKEPFGTDFGEENTCIQNTNISRHVFRMKASKDKTSYGVFTLIKRVCNTRLGSWNTEDWRQTRKPNDLQGVAVWRTQ